MLRKLVVPRTAGALVARSAVAPLVVSSRSYNFFVFKNPERRPQMTPEERAKVKIDYSQWPEEFRDYDPDDPYKNSPEIIEGLTSWNLFMWGVQCAFIYQFYELVYPKSI
eukprot:gene4411-3210_t